MLLYLNSTFYKSTTCNKSLNYVDSIIRYSTLFHPNSGFHGLMRFHFKCLEYSQLSTVGLAHFLDRGAHPWEFTSSSVEAWNIQNVPISQIISVLKLFPDCDLRQKAFVSHGRFAEASFLGRAPSLASPLSPIQLDTNNHIMSISHYWNLIATLTLGNT